MENEFSIKMNSNMNREQKCGYITYLSPTKACNGGKGTQFEIVLQHDEKSSTRVRGFGQDTYRRIKPLHAGKSPVRVELFPNPNFPKTPYTINERCRITGAKFQEVPWDYSEQTSSNDSGVPSKSMSIQKIFDEGDEQTYYSVTGKLRIGGAPVKVRADGNKIKEDITIFDNSGHTLVSLWDELWKNLLDDDIVSLSHMKLRHYGGTHLTSSPQTTITEVTDSNLDINIQQTSMWTT